MSTQYQELYPAPFQTCPATAPSPMKIDTRKTAMSEHVYKTIEITGTSKESSDQAVRSAITKAAETIKNIEWFEVVETRGQVVDKQLKFWQVTMKLGFRIE